MFEELAAKLGTGITAAGAAWSWVGTLNDLLQLAVTSIAVLTGIATYRYVTVKRRLMEKQLNADKDVEQEK